MIKTNYKNLDDALRDVQTDHVIPWGSVHDENDFLVLKSVNEIHKPILKKMAEIATIKKQIEKLGMPYINFTFDIEWDNKNGTWLPTTSLEAAEYPRSQTEAEARELYVKALELAKSIDKDFEVKEVEYEEYDLDLSDDDDKTVLKWLNKIKKLPDGNCFITVKTKEETFKYNRAVDLDKL